MHLLICPRSHGWSTCSYSNDATRSRVFILHPSVRIWRTKGWLGWRESPEDVEVHDRCPRNLPTSWADNTKNSWLRQGAVLKIPYVVSNLQLRVGSCATMVFLQLGWFSSRLGTLFKGRGWCREPGWGTENIFYFFFFFHCYEVYLSQDLPFWSIIQIIFSLLVRLSSHLGHL